MANSSSAEITGDFWGSGAREREPPGPLGLVNRSGSRLSGRIGIGKAGQFLCGGLPQSFPGKSRQAPDSTLPKSGSGAGGNESVTSGQEVDRAACSTRKSERVDDPFQNQRPGALANDPALAAELFQDSAPQSPEKAQRPGRSHRDAIRFRQARGARIGPEAVRDVPRGLPYPDPMGVQRAAAGTFDIDAGK